MGGQRWSTIAHIILASLLCTCGGVGHEPLDPPHAIDRLSAETIDERTRADPAIFVGPHEDALLVETSLNQPLRLHRLADILTQLADSEFDPAEEVIARLARGTEGTLKELLASHGDHIARMLQGSIDEANQAHQDRGKLLKIAQALRDIRNIVLTTRAKIRISEDGAIGEDGEITVEAHQLGVPVARAIMLRELRNEFGTDDTGELLRSLIDCPRFADEVQGALVNENIRAIARSACEESIGQLLAEMRDAIQQDLRESGLQKRSR